MLDKLWFTTTDSKLPATAPDDDAGLTTSDPIPGARATIPRLKAKVISQRPCAYWPSSPPDVIVTDDCQRMRTGCNRATAQARKPETNRWRPLGASIRTTAVPPLCSVGLPRAINITSGSHRPSVAPPSGRPTYEVCAWCQLEELLRPVLYRNSVVPPLSGCWWTLLNATERTTLSGNYASNETLRLRRIPRRWVVFTATIIRSFYEPAHRLLSENRLPFI